MLYKDLVENIVDGKVSHKFNIFKYYDFNDIHLDYIPGGVDATYIFGGNHEALYNDSSAIIDIIPATIKIIINKIVNRLTILKIKRIHS